MQIEYQAIYPFWTDLSQEEKRYAEESCYTETYDKGKSLHRSGENCKGLISVLDGQLRAYVLSEEGREVTLFRVNKGEVCVLSASCLMDSIAFDVLIEAAEQAEVLVLPAICLKSVMQSNLRVELYLYKTATEKFSDVMWTMQQILFQKIDQRVAQFLWDEMLVKEKLVLNVTHEEIAKNIGSAREVVTKVLKYLSEAQVVALKRGKIVILDQDKLKKYL